MHCIVSPGEMSGSIIEISNAKISLTTPKRGARWDRDYCRSESALLIRASTVISLLSLDISATIFISGVAEPSVQRTPGPLSLSATRSPTKTKKVSSPIHEALRSLTASPFEDIIEGVLACEFSLSCHNPCMRRNLCF